jgi:hypothetical protein
LRIVALAPIRQLSLPQRARGSAADHRGFEFRPPGKAELRKTNARPA